MNKQAKKATSRIWSHYGGQILSREAFTTFGGFSDIVDPIIQQAIDAALAEQGAGLQGLVDAAEKAAKARELDEIDGVLLDLDKALSTFRAGKPTLPAEVVVKIQDCFGAWWCSDGVRLNGNKRYVGQSHIELFCCHDVSESIRSEHDLKGDTMLILLKDGLVVKTVGYSPLFNNKNDLNRIIQDDFDIILD